MNSEIKLIHLGQVHKLPFNYEASSEDINEMVESQIKVANYIKDHPEALVFLESLTENFSGVPNCPFTPVAKILFPSGLPDDALKLDSLQKQFLYEEGGAVRNMNRLGELKTMYKTISPEQFEIVDSLISQGDWSHMWTPREKFAMECIREELKQNTEKKEVILVYGNLHDFSKHCLDYGFQHEKISCVSQNKELPTKSIAVDEKLQVKILDPETRRPTTKDFLPNYPRQQAEKAKPVVSTIRKRDESFAINAACTIL